MKKYMIYSAVGIIVLFILDLVLFVKSLPDLISLLLLAFSVLCIMYARSFDRASKAVRTVGSILLIPLSIMLNLLLVMLLLLMAVNFPPAKPFDPGIELVQPAEQEAKAYQEMAALFDGVNKECINLPDQYEWDQNRYDHTFPGLGTVLGDVCQKERQRLLDFLILNKTSVSYEKINGELVLPVDHATPKYIPLINTYKTETISIANLLDKKKSVEASDKYIRLWQAVPTRLSSKEGLINSMATQSCINMLIDLYKEKEFRVTPKIAKQLSDILDSIPDLIDASMAESFAFEYASLKGLILPLAAGQSSPDIEGRYLKWPLFDPYLLLKTTEDNFAGSIEIQKLPFPENRDKLASFDRKMQKYSENPYSLKNPVGRLYEAIAVPSFGIFLKQKETVKSKVAAMNYVIKAGIGSEAGPVPIDNLTGEAFQVDHAEGYLEIKGQEVNFRVKVD